MSPILLLITAGLIVYACYNFLTSKPGKNPPPGLLRLPLWGSYWFLLWGNYKFPHKSMWYYMKKFKSKVISMWMGDFYTIVANDFNTVREVFTRKEFDGRDITGFAGRSRAFGRTLGIFFNDGDIWTEQRRFALRNLRDFGFGRRHGGLETLLNEELHILLDTIKNGPINAGESTVVRGNKVYFPNVLYPIVGNAIWATMAGERFDREHHDELRKLCLHASQFQKGGDTAIGAWYMQPWLRHFGKLFNFHDWYAGHWGMMGFVKRYIDERSESAISSGNYEGLLPAYLKELRTGKLDSGYSEEQLMVIAVDFMFPAISAVPSVIVHAFKLLMHHPEVMKRAQKEIDDVVGRARWPTLDDRKNLPYTDCIIRETMRIEPLTPLGVAHRATEDTTLAGYDVPANTTVLTNLSAMHNDPEFWGDPENFRPERFLNADGTLGKDPTLPFGLGRRVCGGETYARFVMFQIVAFFLHQFNMHFVEGEPTTMDDKYPGLIVQPSRTWIRLTPRD